jgi:membrane protein implicated in regulation of membrane protease activity
VGWWGWIVAGALLLAAELMIPTDFFLVFLGGAALAVGLVGLAGINLPIWGQWLLFAAVALVLLVGVRRRLQRRQPASDPRIDDRLIGEIALIREPLAPGASGRVELRGSQWTACNDDASALEAGARARVERVEGLVLHVRRAR